MDSPEGGDATVQGQDEDGAAGRRHGGVRSQRLAGRGHVRAVPGRPVLGVGVLAGVLRRLPADRDRARPSGRRTDGRRAGAGADRARAAAGTGRRPRRGAGRGAGGRGRHAAAGRRRAHRGQHGGVARACPRPPASGSVPAKLLEVNRTIVNNQLQRTTGGKVSFTHLIGYAVVQGAARPSRP